MRRNGERDAVASSSSWSSVRSRRRAARVSPTPRSALNQKADAATSDLRTKWQAIELADLDDAYSQATIAANATGDYSAAVALFPRTDHATFASAQFRSAGEVLALYSIDS